MSDTVQGRAIALIRELETAKPKKTSEKLSLIASINELMEDKVEEAEFTDEVWQQVPAATRGAVVLSFLTIIGMTLGD